MEMEHRNYLLFFFIIITRSRGKGEVGVKRWGSEGTEESSVVFLKNKGIYYFCDFYLFIFFWWGWNSEKDICEIFIFSKKNHPSCSFFGRGEEMFGMTVAMNLSNHS